MEDKEAERRLNLTAGKSETDWWSLIRYKGGATSLQRLAKEIFLFLKRASATKSGRTLFVNL